jgi:hypothetical protein
MKLLITLISLNTHMGKERVMHHLNCPDQACHKEGCACVSEQEEAEVRRDIHERLLA